MTSLSRRDLFALSAASMLTPAAGAGHARPNAPHRAFRKAVKYGMIGAGDSVLAKFGICKRAGFDGVEMDSPGGPPLREVLAARDATGLQIPGVVDSEHWGKPLSDPGADVRAAGVAALTTALRDCKQLGGSSVLLVPAVVTKQVGYAEAWDRSQTEIRKVLPLAAELGIEILIENVWNQFLLGPTELARYVDELQSPWVGVHFDAGNLVRFGHPEHWVPILGKRIRKVDVKDYRNGRAGHQGFDVKLNEGDTDWPTVVAALRRVGYDGWFTAEMPGGDEAHLGDLAARMDKFLAG